MRKKHAAEIRAGILDCRRGRWNTVIAGPYFFYNPGARSSLYRTAWYRTEQKLNLRPPKGSAAA